MSHGADVLFDTASPRRRSVVLSYGMGVESTAILLRWLHEPATRDFALDDLIVLTAVVGHEFAATTDLVTEHVLPVLRRHRVRYVQVARAGRSDRDGVAVLDDSTTPMTVHRRGAHVLGDELAAAGTVPQVAHGRRLCSIRFKGWPLDTWLVRELAGAPYRHVLGFNADETSRIARDRNYSTITRSSEYPLLTWGWTRADAESYLLARTGHRWPKSCCTFCPFAGHGDALAAHLARWQAEPGTTLAAIRLDATATALNPNVPLFGTRTVRDALLANGHSDLLHAADRVLSADPWSVYDVRRILWPRRGDPMRKGPAWRAVRSLDHGSAADMAAAVRRHAAGHAVAARSEAGGVTRAVLRARAGCLPDVEHFIVAAPSGVDDKQRPGFDDAWRRLTGEAPTLFG